MHWGVYEVEMQVARAVALHPFKGRIPDPSPIGLHMLATELDAIAPPPGDTTGFLHGRSRTGRGREPFVEVPWDPGARLGRGDKLPG